MIILVLASFIMVVGIAIEHVGLAKRFEASCDELQEMKRQMAQLENHPTSRAVPGGLR